MRTLWLLTETIHTVVYFAPEKADSYRAAGLRGGWMGYFGSRAAAMGPVGPEVVCATFYNFHPAMVERAIPDAWRFSSPERVTEARWDVARKALRRVIPTEMGDAADRAGSLMRTALSGISFAGRPLAAAHAGLPWPDDPLLSAWHGCTVWREYRGDAHVAALVSAGLGPVEAHLTLAAGGATSEDELRLNRGWSENDWATARSSLIERGLVQQDGHLSAAGQGLRAEVERVTDRCSAPPWKEAETAMDLVTLLQPIASAIARSGVIPFPNPMGLSETELRGALSEMSEATP